MKDEIEVLMNDGQRNRPAQGPVENRQHKAFLLDQLAHESDDGETQDESPVVRRLLRGMTHAAVGAVVIGVFIMLWSLYQHLSPAG